jgi:hypothetical protein
VKFAQEQRDKAFTEFEQVTPEGRFKSLKAHLDALDVSDTESFKSFFEALAAFYDLVRSWQ